MYFDDDYEETEWEFKTTFEVYLRRDEHLKEDIINACHVDSFDGFKQFIADNRREGDADLMVVDDVLTLRVTAWMYAYNRQDIEDNIDLWLPWMHNNREWDMVECERTGFYR